MEMTTCEEKRMSLSGGADFNLGMGVWRRLRK